MTSPVEQLHLGFDVQSRKHGFMTLHLIKLCVGAESLEDQQAWIAHTLERKRQLGLPVEQYHTTRMVPKRAPELLDGGSLYWVIKGVVQGRQVIADIRPFKDDQGVGRCHLVLEPELIATRPQPRRAFQGWRYLQASDAPVDLNGGQGEVAPDMPATMRQELVELGLL